MPLTGLSGHLSLLSLPGIAHTHPARLCCSPSLPTAIAKSSLGEGAARWEMQVTHISAPANTWHWLPPPPCCILEGTDFHLLLPAVFLRHGHSLFLYLWPVCNAQSLYLDYFAPLAHTPSPAGLSPVTSTMLFSYLKAWKAGGWCRTARGGNNAVSMAWAKFLSWRLVLLFTKEQQTNEGKGAVTSHLHQTNRLIFSPFFYN